MRQKFQGIYIPWGKNLRQNFRGVHILRQKFHEAEISRGKFKADISKPINFVKAYKFYEVEISRG